MKKFSILALSATVAITPAFAETTAHYNTPSVDAQTIVLPQTTVSATTPQADLSFAFDDAENLQTKEMTTTEMQETEGAVLPVGILLNVGGRFVTNQLAKHYISNAGLVYGTYTWGKGQGKQGK
ncbi:hypothetical protein AAX05_00305 [Moraxella bovoculi]|uniref:TonB-dependent receptor n=1 Tax=Moraxella bovoculi TaxID=386891 RepID=A0AAC8PU33_9GAMM|nr:hypothetical protein [Moraxella bovoculi]AKG06895.1 hypothetical protein AAX06_00305 [Moraxella bovoculi]AKG08884.1 hypothetical protein AAX05_00305 [Moraxella bovoculi]AKG10715.1 hypothetical protein AAX07_00305 [Moraxella bovoculi]AKG12754.1 hypothetical protein AAX11_00305 [Moraxella bovoculi]